MSETVLVHDWFSFSHWGMFRLPLVYCPDWFAMGMTDIDDEDFEYATPPSAPKEEGR